MTQDFRKNWLARKFLLVGVYIADQNAFRCVCFLLFADGQITFL